MQLATVHFHIQSGQKQSAKKPLQGKATVSFATHHNGGVVLQKCLKLHPEFPPHILDFVTGTFHNNVMCKCNLTIHLSNGTVIFTHLNDEGKFHNVLRHFVDKKLTKLSDAHQVQKWTHLARNFYLKNATKHYLVTDSFSKYYMCKHVSKSLLSKCLKANRQRLCDLPVKIAQNDHQGEYFNLLIPKKMDQDFTSFKDWIGMVSVRRVFPFLLEEETILFARNVSFSRIEIDMPELIHHPHLIPDIVFVLRDDRLLFVDQRPQFSQGGKVVIQVAPHAAELANTLATAGPDIPFTFEFHTNSQVEHGLNLAKHTMDEAKMAVEGRLCPNGKLCGMVRKFGQISRDPNLKCDKYEHLNLGFLGRLDEETGYPVGPCFRGLIGGGFLFANFSNGKSGGQFSGANVAYIYPDAEMAMVGKFDQFEMLSSGILKNVEKWRMESHFGIMVPQFGGKISKNIYTYKSPNQSEFGAQPNIEDEIAAKYVKIKPTNTKSNDGAFAIRDIEKDTLVMQYGGYRVSGMDTFIVDTIPGGPYRHGVTFCDLIVDIPNGFTDVQKYNATLAHKSNHNFDSNMRQTQLDSVRNGIIGAFKTTRAVKAGEQLFSNYGYSQRCMMQYCAGMEWYRDEWLNYSANFNEHAELVME